MLRSFHTKSIDINNCEWQSVPDMDCDLAAMVAIWNEVVEDGIAFPQEELLTEILAVLKEQQAANGK